MTHECGQYINQPEPAIGETQRLPPPRLCPTCAIPMEPGMAVSAPRGAGVWWVAETAAEQERPRLFDAAGWRAYPLTLHRCPQCASVELSAPEQTPA